MGKLLSSSFYCNNSVTAVAKQLLGKRLISNFNKQLCVSRIVEVEAYNGIHDKASHSYNNRRTNRTEIMYAKGGVAYIYLCYGMHYMLNVVTGVINQPTAVLIRATEPLQGVEMMLARTQKPILNNTLTKGPGNVCKAMGINKQHNGLSLNSKELCIQDDGFVVEENNIITTPRIGIDYAAEDALLPYRFFIKDNPFVSGKKIVTPV